MACPRYLWWVHPRDRQAWFGGIVVVLAGLSLAGCPSQESSDEEGGTSEAEVPIPSPAFISPAQGEVPIESTRHIALEFSVEGITPGNTQVLLDDRSLGALAGESVIGELDEGRLRLYLRGALALGKHTLRLVSSGDQGPLFSSELTLAIEAPKEEPPAFRAVLVPDPITSGDSMTVGGGGILTVLDMSPAPVVRVVLPEKDGWAGEPAAEVPLDGYVFEPMSFRPAYAATRTAQGLRVAHRRGLPGDAVVTREVVLMASPELGEPRVALDLSAEIFGGSEATALGSVGLVADALLVEFTAAADSEVPHPGDRGLVHQRWRAGGWTHPERVATAAPTDLDALGPLVGLADLDQSRRPAFAARVGRRWPARVMISQGGGAQVEIGPASLELPEGDPSVVTALTSDLDAYAILGATPGTLGLALYSTSGVGEAVKAVPSSAKLPKVPLSAAPAVGVVLGYSTFLAPFGGDAPVHVLFSQGARVFVAPLEQPAPLYCDAVALFPGLGGNAPAPALAFACLREGTLRHGVLSAGPA